MSENEQTPFKSFNPGAGRIACNYQSKTLLLRIVNRTLVVTHRWQNRISAEQADQSKNPVQDPGDAWMSPQHNPTRRGGARTEPANHCIVRNASRAQII